LCRNVSGQRLRAHIGNGFAAIRRNRGQL
jgi:hypothetical protein